MEQQFAGDIGMLIKLPFKKYDQYIGYSAPPKLSTYLVIDTLIKSYDRLYMDDSEKIVIVGDSFSDQDDFGYKNYLAHLLGHRITNIVFRIGNNQLNTAISLLNSGIIDSATCRILILQVVGRHAIEKLRDIDLDLLYELPKTDFEIEKIKDNSDLHNLFSFIRLRVNYENPIHNSNLEQSFFTHSFLSRKVFYTDEDLRFRYLSKADIDKAQENLLLLSRRFSEKGIQMIFLIAADKYDVYRPFMTDHSLPVDTTTDGLSNIPDVCVIDTKPLFQKMIRNGEKDVYMLHDSHWSYKGSEAVAHELFRHINEK